MSLNTDIINVALAVYDPNGTYSQHAGVVMTSIFENTRSLVCVYILHDETLTESNREKFSRTAKKYGQSVVFVDVRKCVSRLDKATVNAARKWSIGALFRLFIPDLLDIDKVIYLDCDILVRLDIRELWNTDVEDYCLAGVLDGSCNRRFFSLSYDSICDSLNGCPSSSYINSGVLLMNLKRIREWGNLFQMAMKWRIRHSHTNRCIDQDILNSLFFGFIKFLDVKFNRRDNGWAFDPQKHDAPGSILHLTGPKPWNGFRGNLMERLYWKTYLRSVWGEDITADKAVDLLCDMASRSPYMHRHTSRCYQQIGIRLFRDIFHPLLFTTIGILLQEAFYRVRECLSHEP